MAVAALVVSIFGVLALALQTWLQRRALAAERADRRAQFDLLQSEASRSRRADIDVSEVNAVVWFALRRRYTFRLRNVGRAFARDVTAAGLDAKDRPVANANVKGPLAPGRAGNSG